MEYIVLSISILIVSTAVVFLLVLQRKYQKELEKIKSLDLDTGIGNLYYFEQSFAKRITDENRENYNIAYIKIDSNYLQMHHNERIFTDTIMYTAQVLKDFSSENGFVSRISESGFGYAFESATREETEKKINGIVERLNSYIDTVGYNKDRFFCISVHNLKTNERNLNILLYNLRQKCDEIINTPNQILYFDKSIIRSIDEEKLINESIIKGFKNNEFKLYLQFIVDNKTKKIVSAEALSRWESPKLGNLMPGKYLPAMEKFGYISQLDYYMFEACCKQLHKWADTQLDNITLSCNITRTTLSQKDFLNKINEISQRYVFEKRKLLIEITEEAIEKNFETAIENAKECKTLGFRIALDDMGTGYTSLKNLCDYPIDVVKLDREILLKMDSINGKAMFKGIVSLAHSLKMTVVCEGVETEEQKNFVDETKCDYIQGFYYSKVFPAGEGENFAKEQLR